MGRKKGINTTTSPSSAVTASSVAVLSPYSYHHHHHHQPLDYTTTTTATTTTTGVSPRPHRHHHHHPYCNSYSHRGSGGGCGGGGGSSSSGSSGKSRKMHCYSDNENNMTTTTADDVDSDDTSPFYSPHHNNNHHHSTTTTDTALSVTGHDGTTPSSSCCYAPRSALATLSPPSLLPSSSYSSPPLPTRAPSHRRRFFLSPLRLWTTFVACALLLLLTMSQPALAAFVDNVERDVGAPPPAPSPARPAGAQLKLNDIQSYLKSLDNNKNINNNINDNTDTITATATTTAAATTTTGAPRNSSGSVKDQEPVSLMWGIGDTTAYVGRLFTYPLPNDAFKGDIRSFKVMEAGKKDLPKWLYFNTETRTFSGVPKTADIAQYYIEVVAQSADQGPTSQFAKDVFSIHVTKESSKPAAVSGSLSSSMKDNRGSNTPPVVRCMPLEPETAFTLIVDADLDQLAPHGIVGLLKKLESNLELVSEMFKVGPATPTGNRPVPPVLAVAPDTTLVSGAGDTKTAKHPGVLVTWLVGCGKVEPGHMNVLQRVESISANGTLSELLGHGVVGWHVTNRQVPLVTEKRVRRAVIMATPAVTDVAPTVVAKTTTTHEGDGGMTHRVPTMDSSLVQPTRTHPHSHKTSRRHQDGGMTTLHPSSTAGPRGTLKTKSLPDGMYTMTGGGDVGMTSGVVPPIMPTKPAGGSGGLATAMPEYCSHSRKHKPRVAHMIPAQQFVAGKRVHFTVDADTFVDCKDSSEQLKLDFFCQDYRYIPKDFWLQADNAHDKSMVGLPLQSDVGVHNMTVVAVNSDGMTDALDFFVTVLPDPNLESNQMTHKINMKFNVDYKEFMSSIGGRFELVDKIGKLYGDADSSSITVLAMTEGSVVVSWTNNTLVGTTCPKDATKALFERLVDNKNQVKRSARKAMKPFRLQSAQILPMGPCADGYEIVKPSSTMASGKTTTADPKLVKEPASDDDNDILISTVVPAIIIVSILLLALLVACILYRKKRKGKLSLSSAGEHDAYGGKGAPVIFAEELEDKPTDCQRPLILDDEKPPHPPPEYQHTSSSESAQSTPNQDRRRGAGHRNDIGVNEPILGSQPYEPPPPVTASQGMKQPRPHMKPAYRSPPPYVPP